MTAANRKQDLRPSFEQEFGLDPETSAEGTGIHSARMAENAKQNPRQPFSPDISGLVTHHTAELQLVDQPLQGADEKPGLRDDEKKPSSVPDPNPDSNKGNRRTAQNPAASKRKKRPPQGRAGVIANADNGPLELR